MYPDAILSAFQLHFGTTPDFLVRAPGRINLIGEHTDYNEGFVLPAAIDRAMWFAARPRHDKHLQAVAHDLGKHFSCDLDRITPVKGWPDYLLGVFSELQNAGLPTGGLDLVFGGDIPIGAGLSSSAALESGLLLLLNACFDLGLSRIELARLARNAENNFVGAQCGIMDMYASLFGKAGHALFLDCRSLEAREIPLHLPACSLVLCDTGVQHALAESPFNRRRAECEAGAKAMADLFPEVKNLRDARPEMLTAVKDRLSPLVFQRCRYVLEENKRVEWATQLLAEGRLEDFGALLYASHDGLQQQFEVSCAELDFLVDLTRGDAAVLGARMMGGGFGGCTLNLVAGAEQANFQRRMQTAYRKAWGRDLPSWAVSVSNGAECTLL